MGCNSQNGQESCVNYYGAPEPPRTNALSRCWLAAIVGKKCPLVFIISKWTDFVSAVCWPPRNTPMIKRCF